MDHCARMNGLLMSHSNSSSLATMVLLTVAVVLAALLLKSNRKAELEKEQDRVVLVESGVGESPYGTARSRARGNRDSRHTTTARQENVTSGIRSIGLQTPNPLPPLTGYALDSFSGWTTIPPQYHAESVSVINGALTISTDNGSTDARMGILVSPPIPLKAPAMAAPVQDRAAMPDGASVILEIALSEDGQTWSPWAVAERHRPPDGKRVVPPVQAELSTSDIAAQDSGTTVSLHPGPSLRYRLTLSATGDTAPSVADVRIWKREY